MFEPHGVTIDNLRYSIYNINGQLVKSDQVFNANINVDDLNSGYYVVQFYSPDGSLGVYK